MKTAVATSTSTTAAGATLTWWFEYIPHDIGKLATLLGIFLTSLLIATHSYNLYRKGKLDALRDERERIEYNLRIKVLEQQLAANDEKSTIS